MKTHTQRYNRNHSDTVKTQHLLINEIVEYYRMSRMVVAIYEQREMVFMHMGKMYYKRLK